ncbi:helix-turn-helix domain-containing protein [Luteococcus peritonei]|uniref:Helix-turn-helix domain-containing protein n=1 Tax=Luteococcus peritonei TaxID=88874 RepID=A0ABW4RW43_9ACTN
MSAQQMPRGGTQLGREGERGPSRGGTWGNAEFISIKDAAEPLAVSEVTIRRMIMRGELRGYRVSKRLIRIRTDELAAVLGR